MKRFLVSSALATVGLFAISGCELDPSLFTPYAAEAVFLNVPSQDLESMGVDLPASCTLLVGVGRISEESLNSSNPFEGAGLSGLSISVESPDNLKFELKEEASAPGLYMLSSIDNPTFVYTEGAEYKVTFNTNSQDFWIKLTPAGAVTLDPPLEMGQYQAPGTDLLLSWSPPSDVGVVDVFDSSGENVYTNIPTDLNGIYALLTQSNISSVNIPGATFAADSAYGVAVAGLERIEASAETHSPNLNSIVSKVVTGTAIVSGVTTIQLPDTTQ